MNNEIVIIIAILAQVLAVVAYLFRLLPIQIREAKVRDGVIVARKTILIGNFIFITKSIFYSSVAMLRYLLPEQHLPAILVIGVFFVDSIVSLIVTMLLIFLYTRKYTDA